MEHSPCGQMNQADSMECGQFRQVELGDWRLVWAGEEGSKEFAMREWGSKGGGKPEHMIWESDGGEWDLRSGRELVDGMGVRMDVELESNNQTVFCLDERRLVTVVVILFALINLAIIATGGVGFTLCLVNYWKDQDVLTYVMVNLFKATGYHYSIKFIFR